jgi:hypothetical protein
VKRWSGVLAVEGIETVDGRLIRMGAMMWPRLPTGTLPLMAEGVQVGQILAAIRVPAADYALIVGDGVLDADVAADWESGVGVDLNRVAIEFANPEPTSEALDDLMAWDPGLMTITGGALMGATLTDKPAWEKARIHALDEAA